jgi:DeoR/GlpR family transcriptional regulator of sugar metabolism
MKSPRREKRSASRSVPNISMDDRQKRIVDLLQNEGKIRVEDLADRLRVSQVTMRKDLDSLESRGLIERIHGSAVFSHQSRFNVSFLEKLHINARAKRQIAQAALNLIHEGDSIILDAGTTTFALAQALAVSRLTSVFVITNSLTAALELSKAGYEVLVAGGLVRNHSLALIGGGAVKALEKHRVDRAFLGTSGITVGHGCSTPSAVDAEVKQAMVKAAEEVCILTDSSKFGHNCLVRFASLSEIDLFITDSELSPMFLNELRQNAVAIRLADPIW